MGSPAGIQLRRWLLLLLFLFLGVNLLAVAASLKAKRTLGDMALEAESLVSSTVYVQLEVAAAQNELFQYFAKVSDSTEDALAHLDSVAKSLSQLRAKAFARGVVPQIDRVQESASELKKLIDSLPEGSQRTHLRSKVRQYSSTAATLGKELEGVAAGLTQAAQLQLRRRAGDAAADADATLWLAAGAVLLSLVGIAAVPSWWRRFQELVLDV